MMDENLKTQVELEVRRLLDNEELKLSREMSGQVDKHRAFLQTQFNRMTWGIGIILLIKISKPRPLAVRLEKALPIRRDKIKASS